MIKRFVSILVLYSALAIMLGHNFVEHHHHHDYEHSEFSHHHSDEHHHDNDSEDDTYDFSYLFLGIYHSSEELIFLNNHHSLNNLYQQILKFTSFSNLNFICQLVVTDVKQNAPPYIADYYNSKNNQSFGLRAPPSFIV